MTKTITIFDNRSRPKFGAKFNGSIEDSQTYEVIGYLDFISPALFMKRLGKEDRTKYLDLLVGAEKSTTPTYFSQLKNPITKEPKENAFAILQDHGQDLLVVTVRIDNKTGDDAWLKPAGKPGRYVGQDNSCNNQEAQAV